MGDASKEIIKGDVLSRLKKTNSKSGMAELLGADKSFTDKNGNVKTPFLEGKDTGEKS